MLDTSKVLLFIKSVDPLDQEKVGLLLETDGGLTTDWAVVKRVCNHFDKQREWNDEGMSLAGPTTNGGRVGGCRLGQTRPKHGLSRGQF